MKITDITKSTVHGELNICFISRFAPTRFAATMEITIHGEKSKPFMNISQKKNRTNHESKRSCPSPLYLVVAGGEGGGRGQTIVLGENGLSRGMRMGSMELCFLVFYSGILILYYLIILDQ